MTKTDLPSEHSKENLPIQPTTVKKPPTNLPKDYQQKISVTRSENTTDNWKKLIWYAKKQWNKLTEAELLKSAGDESKLTSLLKDRYSLKHEEATRQVKDFFSSCTNK